MVARKKLRRILRQIVIDTRSKEQVVFRECTDGGATGENIILQLNIRVSIKKRFNKLSYMIGIGKFKSYSYFYCSAGGNISASEPSDCAVTLVYEVGCVLCQKASGFGEGNAVSCSVEKRGSYFALKAFYVLGQDALGNV